MDPLSLMRELLFKESFDSKLEFLEFMFFHCHKLGVDPQAPSFIPEVIPAENQKSCDEHPQESASQEINHHGSEKSLIDDPGDYHPTGSHYHEVKEHVFPQINFPQKWDPPQDAADLLSERIIKKLLFFLFHPRITFKIKAVFLAAGTKLKATIQNITDVLSQKGALLNLYTKTAKETIRISQAEGKSIKYGDASESPNLIPKKLLITSRIQPNITRRTTETREFLEISFLIKIPSFFWSSTAA